MGTSAGNYEATVQHFRDLAKSGDDAEYKRLMGILTGMFRAMNNAYGIRRFRFDTTTDTRYQLSKFMHRFDWIFTLNQDTLLEQHYFTNGFDLASQNRWDGPAIPGIEKLNPAEQVSQHTLYVAKQNGFELPRGRSQPYIKLHGSSNWLAARDADLLLYYWRAEGIRHQRKPAVKLVF